MPDPSQIYRAPVHNVLIVPSIGCACCGEEDVDKLSLIPATSSLSCSDKCTFLWLKGDSHCSGPVVKGNMLIQVENQNVLLTTPPEVGLPFLHRVPETEEHKQARSQAKLAVLQRRAAREERRKVREDTRASRQRARKNKATHAERASESKLPPKSLPQTPQTTPASSTSIPPPPPPPRANAEAKFSASCAFTSETPRVHNVKDQLCALGLIANFPGRPAAPLLTHNLVKTALIHPNISDDQEAVLQIAALALYQHEFD